MSNKAVPAWQPTGLVQKAFNLAAERHSKQTRKGGIVPYLSHLMAVSALVTENGGNEVQASSALLHDVLEDTPTQESELTEIMGTEVNAIVIACSSKRFGDPKEDPWATKDRYLKNLEAKSVDDPSLLVTLADKLHNAQSCVNEYPTDSVERAEYWQKFNAGYELQKHWYTSLYKGLNSKGTLPVPLMKRFKAAIDILFN
jgi:(p)ppGpp synthase/HD superfamily hydrolase